MGRRVTPEDIITINETYLLCGSYNATAKATGWSTSTISKYVDKNYKSSVEGARASSVQIIEPATLDVTVEYLLNHSNLSCLTEQERAGMKEIWRGMLV